MANHRRAARYSNTTEYFRRRWSASSAQALRPRFSNHASSFETVTRSTTGDANALGAVSAFLLRKRSGTEKLQRSQNNGSHPKGEMPAKSTAWLSSWMKTSTRFATSLQLASQQARSLKGMASLQATLETLDHSGDGNTCPSNQRIQTNEPLSTSNIRDTPRSHKGPQVEPFGIFESLSRDQAIPDQPIWL